MATTDFHGAHCPRPALGRGVPARPGQGPAGRLIRLGRDRGVYEWELVAHLPLGRPPR